MGGVSSSSHNLLVTQKVGQWFDFSATDWTAIDLPINQPFLDGDGSQRGDIVDAQLL